FLVSVLCMKVKRYDCFVLVLFVLLIFFVGCNGSAGKVELGSSGRYYIAGRSVEGRDIWCIVFGSGEDVTFVLASIHGDECAGTPLVRRLAGYLEDHPEFLVGRTVVLLDEANPDGVLAGIRHNSRGVDLNRNYYSDNRVNAAKYGLVAMSEAESRIIAGVIWQYGPDRIVSIHQVKDMGPGGLARRYPDGLIDYDGPGKDLAEAMSKECVLGVAKLGASPGSLGSYGGVLLRIPTITFELARDAHEIGSAELWERYGGGLIAAVGYRPN
ncbi:MAG: M14 family zinc carboxypeptidase, partial [Planctomycetota bacterium]